MEGIDPDRLREVRGIALTLAENIDWHGENERTLIANLELEDVQGTIVALCREVDDELRAFAAVAEQKARQVEEVADRRILDADWNGGADRVLVDDALTARLEYSLNDGVGSDGIADSNEFQQYRDGLDGWLEENPEFSPNDVYQKMTEAAKWGDTKALIQLSNAMVQRANSMSDDEGREFLIGCGAEAMLTAAELTQLPATAPVLGALARFATLEDDFDNSWSPLKNFLFSRQGLAEEDRSELANDHLLRLSSRGRGPAERAMKAMVDLRLQGEVHPDLQLLLADTARQLAHMYPSVVEKQTRENTEGQALADLIATGTDGDDPAAVEARAEVDEILVNFIDWTEGNDTHLTDEESSLAIATLYRRLGNTGHGVGFNIWRVLEVLTTVGDPRVKGFASALVAVQGLVVKDPIKESDKKADQYREDQRTAAFMILARRHPEAASAIAGQISAGGMPVDGRITKDMWGKMPQIPENGEPETELSQAAREFNKIMREIKPLWFVEG